MKKTLVRFSRDGSAVGLLNFSVSTDDEIKQHLNDDGKLDGVALVVNWETQQVIGLHEAPFV
jgi:hypothetical protein